MTVSTMFAIGGPDTDRDEKFNAEYGEQSQRTRG